MWYQEFTLKSWHAQSYKQGVHYTNIISTAHHEILYLIQNNFVRQYLKKININKCKLKWNLNDPAKIFNKDELLVNKFLIPKF